jgi:hypothetical protein
MLQIEHAVQGPPTGTSGHKVPYLDTANTWSAQQTITLAPAGAIALGVVGTDPGTTLGPVLDLFRDSAGAVGIGRIAWRGRDSAANSTFYATIDVTIDSPIDGAEASHLSIITSQAGSTAQRLSIGAGLYTPGATGGDKGNNTFNATALYEAGIALTAKYLALAGGSLTGSLAVAGTISEGGVLLANKYAPIAMLYALGGL